MCVDVYIYVYIYIIYVCMYIYIYIHYTHIRKTHTHTPLSATKNLSSSWQSIFESLSVSKRLEHEHKKVLQKWFTVFLPCAFQGGWKRLADSTGEWFVPHGRRCRGAHRMTVVENLRCLRWLNHANNMEQLYDNGLIPSTQTIHLFLGDTHTHNWSSDVWNGYHGQCMG